jgi:Na+/glutamate symporter
MNMWGGLNLICPKCGIENPENAQFCQECGKKLNSETIEKKELNENVNKPALATKKIPLRLIGIIIGVIIIFTIKILFYSISSNFFNLLFYLLCIFGGLVTSLIASGNYKDGAINGLIAGLIGAALSLFYLGNYPSLNIMDLTVYTLGYSTKPAILSLIEV